jgi:hypothetical protein
MNGISLKNCYIEEVTNTYTKKGAGHSGKWPEIFFTGLNDFGHSGLSNLILHFSCKSFTEGKLSG